MADRFVSLATLVRAGRSSASTERHVEDETSATRDASQPTSAGDEPTAHRAAHLQVVRNVRDFAHADVVHELALVRLAAREAFERAAAALLETLAHEVLGRELALAPVDVAALVARAIAGAATCEPVGIAVSAVDRDRVHATLPIRVDASLAAGDLVVDVRDGALVSTFALRLDDALARVAASVRV